MPVNAVLPAAHPAAGTSVVVVAAAAAAATISLRSLRRRTFPRPAATLISVLQPSNPAFSCKKRVSDTSPPTPPRPHADCPRQHHDHRCRLRNRGNAAQFRDRPGRKRRALNPDVKVDDAVVVDVDLPVVVEI